MSILGDLKPPFRRTKTPVGRLIVDANGTVVDLDGVTFLNAIPALEDKVKNLEAERDALRSLYNNRCDKYHSLESQIAAMRKVVEAAETLLAIEDKIEGMEIDEDAYTDEELASMYSALNHSSNALTTALAELAKVKGEKP